MWRIKIKRGCADNKTQRHYHKNAAGKQLQCGLTDAKIRQEKTLTQLKTNET